jgi:tRNA(fMet)-specific endonuclease VapC
MPFMIDTNIAIHARDGHDVVLGKLAEHGGSIMLSALSLAELQRGVRLPTQDAIARRARLDVLLESLPVVSFDGAAAIAYGSILTLREWIKSRDFDRMIAGHALSLGATLVTNNERDFRDIPGLVIENWLSGG